MLKEANRNGSHIAHDDEAERAVLGSLLIDGRSETVNRVVSRLPERDFFDDGNRFIYSAICDLANEGTPPDVGLVVSRLKSKKLFDRVGGTPYMARLAGAAGSAGMIDHYAEAVAKQAKTRRIVRVLERGISEVQSSPDDVATVASHVLSELNDVASWDYLADYERLLDVYQIEKPWTSAELANAKITTTYLVDNVLVEKQSCVIAGGSKGMKTTSGIDLGLSLASPSMFLGKFWVPERRRVLFLSAESGQATIQETALRIAARKRIDLTQLETMFWGFWVPRARNSEMLSILERQLDDTAADVCIIDPLYQVLDGEDQHNLSLNGRQISAVTERCLSRSVTPILIDHVKKTSENAKNFQPLELNDVSGAGKAENFRQWILLSRRERFEPETPIHRLWMTVGGSAGHCGAFAVDIDETRDGDGKRSYDVAVTSASEARESDREAKERDKANKQAAAEAERIRISVNKIRSVLPADAVWSKSQIRTLSGLNTGQLGAAIAHLSGRGEIEIKPHQGKTGPSFNGIQWTKNATHLREQNRTRTNPDETRTDG